MKIQEKQTRFDLAAFKKIDDEGDRLQYATENLMLLGEGGSRVVFKLSPKYVLKVAFTDRGKSQNATEASVSEDAKYSQYLARVHSHAADFSWIISDLVRPLREEEFERFFGIPFEEFSKAIAGRDFWRWSGNPDWKVSSDEEESIGTYGHIMALRDLVKLKKLHTPELNFIEHWGKTPDNRIVILDYGVDEGNWKQQTLYAEGNSKGRFDNQHTIQEEKEASSKGILESELVDCIYELTSIILKS